jgi:ribose transport system substrate-binding protein
MRRLGVLVLAMALLAAACGDDGETSTGADGGSDVTDPAPAGDQKFTIAVSHYISDIPFYQGVQKAIDDAAAEYGWEVIVTDSQLDAAKQTADIEDAITRKVDLILAVAGDEDALIQAYQSANDAGIPIISIFNHLSEDGRSLEASRMGSQWSEVGDTLFRWFGEEMGGEGDFISVRGPFLSNIVREFVLAEERIIGEQYPDINIVSANHSNALSPEEGLRLAQDALTAHPDADAIWTITDGMGLGVMQAIRERGIDFDDILVGIVDGAPESIEAVRKGELDVLFLMPSYGFTRENIMPAVRAFLEEGKALPEALPMEPIETTLENVDEVAAMCDETPEEVHCPR